MEIIRQNSDDRCVAGRRIYVKNPTTTGYDNTAYLDRKCTIKVPYEDLLDAFHKGNLIVAYENHLNRLIECCVVYLTNDVVDDTGRVCTVSFIPTQIVSSVTDDKKGYYNLPFAESDYDPNYMNQNTY